MSGPGGIPKGINIEGYDVGANLVQPVRNSGANHAFQFGSSVHAVQNVSDMLEDIYMKQLELGDPTYGMDAVINLEKIRAWETARANTEAYIRADNSNPHRRSASAASDNA